MPPSNVDVHVAVESTDMLFIYEGIFFTHIGKKIPFPSFNSDVAV